MTILYEILDENSYSAGIFDTLGKALKFAKKSGGEFVILANQRKAKSGMAAHRYV